MTLLSQLLHFDIPYVVLSKKLPETTFFDPLPEYREGEAQLRLTTGDGSVFQYPLERHELTLPRQMDR